MKTKSPCYNCRERVAEPNCHMTCPEFLEWEEEHKHEKEDLRRQKQEVYNKNRISIESVLRAKRRRH